MLQFANATLGGLYGDRIVHGAKFFCGISTIAVGQMGTEERFRYITEFDIVINFATMPTKIGWLQSVHRWQIRYT